MAKIIKNLDKIAKQYELKDYIFQDITLDLTKSFEYDTVRNKKINKNDIDVSYDELAIRNSIKNLFRTTPGQRFLFPKYGLDLTRHLFEAITPDNARELGEQIVATVKKFEPRVKVERCHVNPLYDENTYDITLILSIPIFSTNFTINSSLNIKTHKFDFMTRK